MINSLNLAGRLVADAELKKIVDYDLINFTVAFDTFKKGEKQSNFIDCTMFGSRAKSVHPFMKKGQLVFLSGNIEQQTWIKGDDMKQSKIAYIVQDVTLAGTKPAQQQQQAQDEQLPF